MTTATQLTDPRLGTWIAGTWTIDPVHTDVSFTVRHMMVSKVRGKFRDVSGTIVTAANPLESSVQATVELASLDTDNETRDNHIRSADFFDVGVYPTMSFRSTGVRAKGEDFVLDGELSLHGVTRPIAFDLEFGGFTGDGSRVGFSAATTLNRKDYGIDIELPMDGGGVVVGDKVQVLLEVEAILNQE